MAIPHVTEELEETHVKLLLSKVYEIFQRCGYLFAQWCFLPFTLFYLLFSNLFKKISSCRLYSSISCCFISWKSSLFPMSRTLCTLAAISFSIPFFANLIPACPFLILLNNFSDSGSPVAINGPPLVVGVLSKRDNFMERLAIRNTWAVHLDDMGLKNTKLVFVLGDNDCPLHPSLRKNSAECSAVALPGERKQKWNSIDFYFINGTNKKTLHYGNTCAIGVGFSTVTTVLLNKITVVSALGAQLITGNFNLYLKFADEIMDLGQVSSFITGNNSNYQLFKLKEEINIVLPQLSEAEIFIQLEDTDCATFMNEQSLICKWNTGGDSVQYNYVRMDDGVILPWEPHYCAPFTISFENGEESCPEGWSTFDGHCYYYSYKKKKWHDAKADCEAQDSNLVTITSMEENNFVDSLRKTERIWIGLYSKPDTGLHNFIWADGSTDTFSNWYSNEPNNWVGPELCVEMSYYGKWNDDQCQPPNRYVCKKKRLINGPSKIDSDALQAQWSKSLVSVNDRLLDEQKQHSDLLFVSDLNDTYSSLPQKVKALIKWTHDNHKGAWLFKTDDDTYVNTNALSKLIHEHVSIERVYTPTSPNATFWQKLVSRVMPLIERYTPHTHPPAVISYFYRHRSVPRFGQWAEYEYPALSFPPFPTGAGYLMTDTVVAGLAKISSSLRTFQGEDVSVGVWLTSLSFPYNTGKPTTSISSLPKHAVNKLWNLCYKGLSWAMLAQDQSSVQSAPAPATAASTDSHVEFVPAELVSVNHWLSTESTFVCVSPSQSTDSSKSTNINKFVVATGMGISEMVEFHAVVNNCRLMRGDTKR